MLSLAWYLYLKSGLMETKALHILHCEYRGHWWPGDAQSQGIRRHVIDPAIPQYVGFSTRVF